MLWIRLSLRELMENKGFSFFFILNLSLGLAGFIGVHSFGISLNRHLDENLKEILTADLVMSANHALTLEELKLADQVLGPDKTLARLVQFYTMARAGDNARLVQVMAIDESYPLYGSFSLEGKVQHQEIHTGPNLFMTRDTAHALGLEMGMAEPVEGNLSLVLGNKSFLMAGFFETDPDKSLNGVELAPKIYMGLSRLEGTGLMGFGSRVRYFYYYRLDRQEDIPGLALKLGRIFHDRFPGQSRINVVDTRDVNQRLGRVTRHFTGYMGLVSMVALFLAGIATAYLFQGFLTLKQKEMAILMSLGAVRAEICFYVGFQLILLGVLASFLAILLALLLVPAFPLLFQGLIPPDVRVALDPGTLALASALGILGSLIFCLPVFVRIFGVKPLALLRGISGIDRKNARLAWGQGLSFLPGLGAFFLASVLVAGSPKTGMVFALGFVLALGFLSGMGWLVFSGCNLLSQTRNPVGKIAFRNLFRNKGSSLSCFVTIAMGVFLISLIPQVQKGLQTEIMRPEGLKIPVFFLVDIQDEQKNDFLEFMAGQEALVANISPMVRGRILRVNGQGFYEESRLSSSGNQGFRRAGRRLEFNFSHRKDLDVSETILLGKPLSQIPWDSSHPFEISLETSFADQYGLALGDLMEFDLQGIPMTGRVVNLRKVRWNSFQPNFYLLFQEGVLNDAPKTFLASIAQVVPEKRQDLKNRIVTAFPNISVIDVTQMAQTLLAITDKLSLSLGFMAWLAIGAGLVSIFSIARHEARKNEVQVNLLKVLGADFKQVQAITLVEFGFIGFFAALIAMVLSFGFSLAASWYFFDTLWAFDPMVSLAILLLTTSVCMITALGASWKVMRSKPAKLLANG